MKHWLAALHFVDVELLIAVILVLIFVVRRHEYQTRNSYSLSPSSSMNPYILMWNFYKIHYIAL